MSDSIPQFSIIIPLKEVNDYVRETIEKLKKLNFISWELLILPNFLDDSVWDDVRILTIATGKVSPAIKRNVGVSHSKGNIILFLDDDSYPDTYLLDVYNQVFENSEVLCAGGPGITPPNSTFFQQISGAVYESVFLGGSPSRYRKHGSRRKVDDWPSVNLAIRKKTFLSIGGFNSDFWPGEDSILCNDLKKANIEITMIPEAIVWHHRRRTFIEHIIQAKGYGMHRGHFARKFPENSRKLKYFLPSLMLISTLINLLLLTRGFFSNLQFLGMSTYLLALLMGTLDNVKRHGILKSTLSGVLAIPTHVTYGLFFIMGFATKGQLRSNLR
jgi:cellulose synthase/poly-beta-1,6-N-acetylglucosamine synthase-like glycosyltransferase